MYLHWPVAGTEFGRIDLKSLSSILFWNWKRSFAVILVRFVRVIGHLMTFPIASEIYQFAPGPNVVRYSKSFTFTFADLSSKHLLLPWISFYRFIYFFSHLRWPSDRDRPSPLFEMYLSALQWPTFNRPIPLLFFALFRISLTPYFMFYDRSNSSVTLIITF